MDYYLLTHLYDIRSIISKLYEATVQKLEELERERKQELAGQYASASADEQAASMRFQEDAWEEEYHFRRMQALGLLPLHMLQLAVKVYLDRAKSRFDKTHPPRRKKYDGKGWPNKFKAEYEERFSIDFDRCPVPFSRIQELVLARNAAVHDDESGAMEEYLRQIKDGRFVKSTGEFWVDLGSYRAALADADKFMVWVSSELEKLKAQT